MKKKVNHVVKRPGHKIGDADVEIPVAADLVSVPGSPTRERDVSFYSREYPAESQTIEKSADRVWAKTAYSKEVQDYSKTHAKAVEPLVEAATISGDVEPTGKPIHRDDATSSIRKKARELGFGEVGFTKYDRRYTYASKKRWVKYQHAICLALEQDYDQTQAIPSIEAEYAHYGTYEMAGDLALQLAGHIRAIGYHAQIHSPSDNSGVYIPLFVNAGLGQLGANGQLLSPHFGSRARLMIITTDAPVIYDEPLDYGINKFCDQCQVCVARCPGRALVKDRVWYRGVLKNKLIYDRCRPIMVKYEGCGVCMKVCPIQRYGMKPVMEHYVETGEILGKGTSDLEGYSMRGKGHFDSGELPHFDRDMFDIPHGTTDEWLLHEFKTKIQSRSKVTKAEAVQFADDLKAIVDNGINWTDE